jgi:hypothetical protein
MRAVVDTPGKAGTAGVSPQTYVVNLPTYVAGDVMIVQLLVFANDLGVPDSPVGWTLQGGWAVSGSGTPIKTATFTRVMTGSEGSTLTFSKSTGYAYNWKAVASSWQGVDSVTPIEAATSNSSGGGTVSPSWSFGPMAAGGGSVREVVGVLTMQQLFSGDDITTSGAAAPAYEFTDTHTVLSTGTFRLALEHYSASVSGSYAISGGFTAGHQDYWGVRA